MAQAEQFLQTGGHNLVSPSTSLGIPSRVQSALSLSPSTFEKMDIFAVLLAAFLSL